MAWTYTRNPANQIATLTRDNDAYAWTGHYAGNRPYTTNGLNQYIATGIEPDVTSFQYDANGNLVTDGTNAYLYDVENRLVQVAGTQSGTIVYDPLGRIFEYTGGGGITHQFLYDGDALVAEYNVNAGGVMLRRYVHSVGADVPVVWYEGTGLGDPRYLYPDHQGSIVAVLGPGGTPSINRYDEYGIPQGTISGRFAYTGQTWLPEMGLYHYKARIYSPTLGRFLQTDPVAYDDQFNLYAYVGNDPMNRADPTGTHGRGTGFSDSQWRRLNRAQLAMARQLDGGARRINRSIERGGRAFQSERRRFERQFGPGTGTEANMRAAATTMSTLAAAFRDDGTNGYWAEGRSAEQFRAEGRGPDVAGYVSDDRPRTMIMNVDHPAFDNPARLMAVVGHEGGHTVGLRDAVVNGATAYRNGLPNQREAYRLLPTRDPNAAMINPDSILEYSE